MRNSRVTLYAIIAGVAFALSVYAIAGVMQAAIVLTGQRAQQNFLFWGSVSLALLTVAVVFAYLAIRSSLLGLKRELKK